MTKIMMVKNKMKFPILSFKEGENYIYFIEKEKVLLTTTESLLKKGVFNKFVIVDSNGFVFKFKNAKKVGYVGFFGINPLLKEWWKDREIKIEMDFENNIEKMELNDLKELLHGKLEKTKQFWNLKNLRKAINEAKTYQEIIILFK